MTKLKSYKEDVPPMNMDEMSYEAIEPEDDLDTAKLQPADPDDIGNEVEAEIAPIAAAAQSKPSLQYDPKEDPEYGEGGLNESGILWKGYMKKPKRLVENIVSDLVRFIVEDCDGDPDMINQSDFFAKYPQSEGTRKWNLRHPEAFAKSVASAAAKLGKSAPASVGASPNTEPTPPKELDRSVLSRGALDMVEETEAMESESLEKTLSLEDQVEAKYDNLYMTAAGILSGRSTKKFALICGDAGVGKSYSVNKAIKDVWPSSKLNAKGWHLTKTKGAIGNAITNIVVYFFTHRNKEVIIMDDADGFLLTTDQNVQNLLKGMMDTENTPDNPQYITIPTTIATKATKSLASMKEGVTFNIDQDALREGRLEVSVNGKKLVEAELTEEELSKFKLEPLHEEEPSYKSYNPLKTKLFRENDEEDGDEEEFITGEDPEDEEVFIETEENEVPTQWLFTSRIILISNLEKSQLNDAVASRCDVVSLHLEPDEFCCRLAQILPNLMKDKSATEIEPELIDYAKNTVFGLFNNIIELAEQGFAPYGIPVRINPKALQFRIIPELAGGWIRTADAWVMEWNRQNPGKPFEAIPQNYEIIAQNIKKTYIKTVLLPALAEGLKSKGPTKKKSYIG